MADETPPPFDPNAPSQAALGAPPFDPNAPSQGAADAPPFDPNAPSTEAAVGSWSDVAPDTMSQLKGMITDIPHQTYRAGAQALSTVSRAFNPYDPRNAADQDAYLKELSSTPWWDPRPGLAHEWQRFKDVGAGLAAIPAVPGALLTGPGRSIIGHGFEAVTPTLTPEEKAKLAQVGIEPMTGEQVADLALSAIRPAGAPIRTVPPPGTPAGPYEMPPTQPSLAWQAPPKAVPATPPAPPTPPKQGPFGVTLSQGEETGDLANRIQEQSFLRQGSPHAQAWREQRGAQLEAAPQEAAAELDPYKQNIVSSSQEAADIVNNALTQQQRIIDSTVGQNAQRVADAHEALRTSLSPTSKVIANSPLDAADHISWAVANEAEKVQQAKNAAYDVANNLPGQFHPATFNKAADTLRAAVDRSESIDINPESTPVANTALSRLDNIIDNLTQHRDPDTGRILKTDPITMGVVDEARKRLNVYLGQAKQAAFGPNGKPADAIAMRGVVNAFDDFVEGRLAKGLFTGGDPAAARDAFANARKLNTQYRQTFTPRGAGDTVGRAIQTILGRYEGQAAPPEQVQNILYGKGTQPVQVARRLKQMFGADSPEVGAAKQGLFSFITERPPGATAWGPEKVADRIDEFTQGPGRSLTQEYLSQPEIKQLQQHALDLRQHATLAEAAQNPFEGVDFHQLFRKVLNGDKDALALTEKAFDRLNQLSPDGKSPAVVSALRQGLLLHAIRPVEGVAAPGYKTVGDQLSKLLQYTKNSPIFTPEHRQAITAYRDLMRKLEMPRDTYAPSAPAIHRLLSAVGYRTGQIIGAIIGRSVTPGVPLVGEFAGITIGGKLERIAENRALGKVSKQLPLVADQVAKYQKALNAYNRAQNGGTRKLLGIAAVNMNQMLNQLGINGSMLQLPGTAPAEDQQKPKQRADGGPVDDNTTTPTDWSQYIGPNGIPRINMSAGAGPTTTPGDAMVANDQPPAPVAQPTTEQPHIAINDAGIPFNTVTGEEYPHGLPGAEAPPAAETAPDNRSMTEKLLGQGGDRYQLWPERMVRSGFTAPREAYATGALTTRDPYGRVTGSTPIDVSSSTPSDNEILRSQDIAGMSVGAGLPSAEEGALGMAGGKLPPGWKTIEGAGGPPKPLNTPEQIAEFRAAAEGRPSPAAGPTMNVKQLYSPQEMLKRGEQYDIPDPSKLSIQRSRTLGDNPRDVFFVTQPDPAYASYASHVTKPVTGFYSREEAEGFIRAVQGQQRPADYTGPKLLAESGKAGAPLAALEHANQPLYSTVERAIQNAPQAKMSGAQWLGWLKNQPGVKAEELSWLGLDDPSRLPQGAVSKEALLQHVKENGLQLGEVEKKSTPVEDPDAWAHGQVEDAFYRQYPRASQEEFAEYMDSHEGQTALSDAYAQVEGNTKYSGYQLPGGENYRELLLTMPEKQTAPRSFEQFVQDTYGQPVSSYPQYMQDSLRNSFAQAADIEARSASNKNNYHSSHWDEPNVLVHMRMNDRDIPGVGKSLHLEEVQSDWGQGLRKQRNLVADYVDKNFDGVAAAMVRDGLIKKVCD